MSDDEESAGGELTKREGLGRPTKATKRLERGTLVGRYVVFDVVGEGGMGIVYNAYDPELDRRLAIKVVQAKPGGSTAGGDQARLLREAQALARLSHPNVIAVHDVGTLPGDRVFVAMELVEGITLRAWLREPRTWREVQAAMLAAGAGLAAAHAAGLVHRDFKPENVIVGADGRVRVMDFGLARLAGEEHTDAARESNLTIEVRSPLSANLTIDGSLVGTPAYMAPEIYDGLAADARTDQFAFGVALYEALFRMRPFEKKALMPPRATPPVAKEPASSAVPQAIQRVALRALAAEPAERYHAMDDLLRELAADPSRSQRRLMIAAGAAVVIAGTIAGAAVLARSSSATTLCTAIDRRLVGVWDEPVKQAVRAAFGKSQRPFAPRALVALTEALDHYATEWTAASTDSCRATRVRGEQTEEAFALREACFDQRLEELHAYAAELARADDTTIDRAPSIALALEPVTRCANLVALRAPAPPSPEAAPKLVEINARLSEARAAMTVGKVPAAMVAAKKALELARAIGLDTKIAEAAHRLGAATLLAGRAADAAKLLEEAAWTGLRAKADDVAAYAALDAAIASSEGLHDDGAARVLLAAGTAAAQRYGRDNKLELKRLEIEGIVSGTRGDLVAATAAHEKALALALEMFGAGNMSTARDEQLLAATLAKAGEFAVAQPHYERALELVTRDFGAEHPDAALMLSGLGACYHHTGAIAKAHDAFARAIAIREHVFGPNSAVLITTLNNHAELYRDEGNADAGLALAERARAIALATVGTNHPYFHVVATTQAELLIVAHRNDEARALLAEVLAIEDKLASPMLAGTLAVRAHLAITEEKWTDAAAFAERAIAGFEKSAGPNAADLRKPLVDLARARLRLDRAADARPLLERALAIGEKAKVPAEELAPIRALLDDQRR